MSRENVGTLGMITVEADSMRGAVVLRFPDGSRAELTVEGSANLRTMLSTAEGLVRGGLN